MAGIFHIGLSTALNILYLIMFLVGLVHIVLPSVLGGLVGFFFFVMVVYLLCKKSAKKSTKTTHKNGYKAPAAKENVAMEMDDYPEGQGPVKLTKYETKATNL